MDDARFHLSVSESGTHASVCRLRSDDVEPVFGEVTAAAPHARITWTFAEPGLEPALRALGCHDQDPPLTSHITALATDAPPPPVDGVDVKRVETYDDFVLACDVSARGWETEPDPDPRATWARRRARPGGEWLAFVDGEPAAYGGSIAGPAGVFLTGGVTVPHARGRGAYRALLRARWDDAAQRGTPALVVHAEEASRRVLERVGFAHICAIVELVSDPA